MKIDAREFKKAASPVQFYSQMEFTKNPVLEVKPSPEPIIVQETPPKAKFKKGFHFEEDKMALSVSHRKTIQWYFGNL